MNDSNTVQQPEKAVCFKDVYFSYGNLPVFEHLSFEVYRGEFAALAGPNGSGKTTVLKVLLGLEKPQAGTVDVAAETAGGGIGYVPQQAPFDKAFPIPVREVVKMGRLKPWSRKWSGEDEAALGQAMEQTEIADLADRPYAKLSGGQRRRVLVARALASRPGLLILDEPAAGMDTESEERLFAVLKKLKGTATVFMVTHDLDSLLPITDRVIRMGRIK
jgi:zinc transport system ATP-binding protein